MTCRILHSVKKYDKMRSKTTIGVIFLKKTFTTTLPDRIGAFLSASEALSALGVNITRVSYNKAIDTHMLFLEVEGSEEMLQKAEQVLFSLGYLQNEKRAGSVILLEFHLKDEPSRLTPVLTLIEETSFNISYMSSQQNESGYQDFKIGLFVENGRELSDFIEKAATICPVRILNYDRSEKVLDNTVFYLNFAETISEKMQLNPAEKEGLMVCANRIMQMLDEEGSPFYKTFDYISRLAEHIESHKGENFSARITKEALSGGATLTLIEPPCGSNIVILEKGHGLLFVDSGFACYRKELEALFRELFPSYDKETKELLLTHSDVDHAGILDLFDRVHLTKAAQADFLREQKKKNAYREENPLHQPYAYISKILTRYRPPKGDNFCVFKGERDKNALLSSLGRITTCGFTFEVYEGQGGHILGEAVYLDREHNLLFTGDIFVNIKGFTREQKAFNKLAPYLMTSVDTDPTLAKKEREALFPLLSEGEWKIIGGHGGIYSITIPPEKEA